MPSGVGGRGDRGPTRAVNRGVLRRVDEDREDRLAEAVRVPVLTSHSSHHRGRRCPEAPMGYVGGEGGPG